jgi:hypothetical protein
MPQVGSTPGLTRGRPNTSGRSRDVGSREELDPTYARIAAVGREGKLHKAIVNGASTPGSRTMGAQTRTPGSWHRPPVDFWVPACRRQLTKSGVRLMMWARKWRSGVEGGMSMSGLHQHGHGGPTRRPWQAPSLSVLVFRATANSTSTGTDLQTSGQIVNQSPPPPPPLPPPPPPPPPQKKGDFACDAGAFVGAGTGASAPTTAFKPAAKHPDTHVAASECQIVPLS